MGGWMSARMDRLLMVYWKEAMMPQERLDIVRRSEARSEARVTFEDESVYSAPVGTPLRVTCIAIASVVPP